MKRLPAVVLADPNPIVRNRIKTILANQDINFYEASTRLDILNVMSENENRINLIITDIEIDMKRGFDGVSLIKLVRSRNESIPVVVLTSISRKDVIMKCLKEGAADYILKPFEDEYLKEKVLKYIDIESLTEYTILKFNLRNFLAGEIHKARKGNYSFSLLMVNFRLESEEEANQGEYGFYRYAETLYRELKALFWESDLYIQHGSQCHLGFFPFCNQEHTDVIRAKIFAKFNQLKLEDPLLSNYSISQVSSTYPLDGNDATELLRVLTEEAAAQIVER